MEDNNAQEPEYKRRRTGVLATGYFNLIGLPGVSARIGDNPVYDPRNTNQIKFDGNANQLFYPPDFLTVKDDGVYAKKKNDSENYQEVRIGDVDLFKGPPKDEETPEEDPEGDTDPKTEGNTVPLFETVTPNRTNEEIERSANKAVEAIQKEVDIWTRRFYVFAGGDFGANRSLTAFVWPPESVSMLGDHFDLDPGMSVWGIDGRWNGQYAKHVKIDLTNNSYGNITFHTGKRTADYQITLEGEPGVNLNRNKRLHFDAYLVSGGQASIEVTVGDAGSGSGQEVLGPYTLYPTPTKYEKDISASVDLSDTKHLVKFEMKTDHFNTTQQEYVIAITNVWFEWTGPDDERLFDKCFVKSWSTPKPDTHFGVILQNTCFTYDQTLAMYALWGAGDDERALVLLRALMHVIQNDPDYDDARVRNGYRCGPAEPIEGEKGVIDTALPGWWGRNAWTTEQAKANGLPKEPAGNLNEYGQDPYAISTWVGTAAWVMMALTSAYRYYAPMYSSDETRVSSLIRPLYDKMIALSEWVVDRFKSTTDYFKGYMGGLYGFYSVDYSQGEDGVPRVPAGVYKTPSGQYEGPGQFILPWRSVEHCADLYAAFKHLYEITGNPKWGIEMRHALDYIDKLWYDGPLTQPDGTEWDNLAMYLTGTGEVDEDLYNTVPNTANLPTDPTVWVTYGTNRLDTTRLRALDFLHRNARVVGGDPNSMWKYSVVSNGGWIEGAGQVAILFKAYGFPSWWAAALAPCLDQQLDSGMMYSVTETASTGFNLPNVGLQDQPWKYFKEGHMGATSWFVIGHRQINPFKFPVDHGTLAPSTDIRPGALGQIERINDIKVTQDAQGARINDTEAVRDALSVRIDDIEAIQGGQDARITAIESDLSPFGSVPACSTLMLGIGGLQKESYTNPLSAVTFDRWKVHAAFPDLSSVGSLLGRDPQIVYGWSGYVMDPDPDFVGRQPSGEIIFARRRFPDKGDKVGIAIRFQGPNRPFFGYDNGHLFAQMGWEPGSGITKLVKFRRDDISNPGNFDYFFGFKDDNGTYYDVTDRVNVVLLWRLIADPSGDNYEVPSLPNPF